MGFTSLKSHSLLHEVKFLLSSQHLREKSTIVFIRVSFDVQVLALSSSQPQEFMVEVLNLLINSVCYSTVSFLNLALGNFCSFTELFLDAVVDFVDLMCNVSDCRVNFSEIFHKGCHL